VVDYSTRQSRAKGTRRCCKKQIPCDTYSGRSKKKTDFEDLLSDQVKRQKSLEEGSPRHHSGRAGNNKHEADNAPREQVTAEPLHVSSSMGLGRIES
jgi:hypothetical protein